MGHCATRQPVTECSQVKWVGGSQRGEGWKGRGSSSCAQPGAPSSAGGSCSRPTRQKAARAKRSTPLRQLELTSPYERTQTGQTGSSAAGRWWQMGARASESRAGFPSGGSARGTLQTVRSVGVNIADADSKSDSTGSWVAAEGLSLPGRHAAGPGPGSGLHMGPSRQL